jgi:hypothetical protein
MPRDEVERNQLVALLAQGINGPADPLETRVAHWRDPVKIAIIGRDAAAQDRIYEEAIAPFMSDFKAMTGTPFRRVSEDKANVLVILAEDVAAVRRDFEPQIDRVLQNPVYTAVFETTMEENSGECTVMALDDNYLYFGAVILSSKPESDPSFTDCVAPALASMVGLQGKMDQPGSIKSPGKQLQRPTDLDRKALSILYGLGKPGERLGDIAALRKDI